MPLFSAWTHSVWLLPLCYLGITVNRFLYLSSQCSPHNLMKGNAIYKALLTIRRILRIHLSLEGLHESSF